GWFTHRCPNGPRPTGAVLSTNRDSTSTVRDRVEAVLPPPITAAILTGRRLTSRERVSLPTSVLSPTAVGTREFADTSSCEPFAIDTALCRADNSGCDTVEGYVVPRDKMILAFQVRHAPVYVTVHDTTVDVREDVVERKEDVLSLDGDVLYEAVGGARDITLTLDGSLRIGGVSILVSPELSLLYGLSGRAGLGFHIY